MAEFNDKRAERMFYMRQLGMTYAAIGAKFDLTPWRISCILAKRERWAELPLHLEEGFPACAREVAKQRLDPRLYAAVGAWSLLDIATQQVTKELDK